MRCAPSAQLTASAAFQCETPRVDCMLCVRQVCERCTTKCERCDRSSCMDCYRNCSACGLRGCSYCVTASKVGCANPCKLCNGLCFCRQFTCKTCKPSHSTFCAWCNAFHCNCNREAQLCTLCKTGICYGNCRFASKCRGCQRRLCVSCARRSLCKACHCTVCVDCAQFCACGRRRHCKACADLLVKCDGCAKLFCGHSCIALPLNGKRYCVSCAKSVASPPALDSTKSTCVIC